jgi:hypothetical protein
MQPKYYGAAAEYNKPAGGSAGGLSGILKIFGIFIGAIIVIAVVLSIVSSIGKGPQNDFARLVARMSSLQNLLDKQKGNIRSSDLRTVSATALILVSGDTSTLAKQMRVSFGLEAVPEDITAAETDTTTDPELKKAQLTGGFDREYVTVLRDKIAAAYQLAETLKAAGGNDATIDALNKTLVSLDALDSQLTKLAL